MNTRTLFISAGLAGILNCAPVGAQVLGGNVGGALNGGLNGGLNGALRSPMSGGMRDVSVLGDGSAAGSLGADFDTQTLRRTTRDTTGRAIGRVRDTTQSVRGRAQSTVGEARDVTASAAASAANNPTDSNGTMLPQLPNAPLVDASGQGDAAASADASAAKEDFATHSSLAADADGAANVSASR